MVEGEGVKEIVESKNKSIASRCFLSLIFVTYYNSVKWKKALQSDALFLLLKVSNKGTILLKSLNYQKARLRPPTNCTWSISATSSNLGGGGVTKSKNKKKRPKNHSLATVKGWMRLKSQDPPPPKAHLRPLQNVHTCFQLPCSIWRGLMRETNSKNKKKTTKKSLFCDSQGMKWGWKVETSKKHI